MKLEVSEQFMLIKANDISAQTVYKIKQINEPRPTKYINLDVI